ncbi:hypothetical protein BC830DRAFT_798486 [Chytriomyces sp. MP71]|nr:hypothetical protein BC830DRAFT_798486 [Chytriomyces sp. MP71]
MFPSVTIRRSSSAGAACGKRSSLATKTPSRSRTISHPAAASPSSRNSRPCSIKTEIIPKLSIRHASLRQGVPLSFACAYVPNKMLLQGVLNFKEGVHAFVFSSIFLREEIILPFESVISVEKSKLGFIPNSLTIRAHGGKEYFFTSFLNRDYARRRSTHSSWKGNCVHRRNTLTSMSLRNPLPQVRGDASRKRPVSCINVSSRLHAFLPLSTRLQQGKKPLLPQARKVNTLT